MPLIPLSGPISMSMLNTAVARSSTTANSLLANGETPANPGLFYLGYQINNSLNQTAPHAMSEWYGFDTTTTTTTTTTSTTTTTTIAQGWYSITNCANNQPTWSYGPIADSYETGKVAQGQGGGYYYVNYFTTVDPQVAGITLTAQTQYTDCNQVPTTTTTAAPGPPPIEFTVTTGCTGGSGTGFISASGYTGGNGSYQYIAYSTSSAGDVITKLADPARRETISSNNTYIYTNLADNSTYWVGVKDTSGLDGLGNSGFPVSINCTPTTTTSTTTTTTTLPLVQVGLSAYGIGCDACDDYNLATSFAALSNGFNDGSKVTDEFGNNLAPTYDRISDGTNYWNIIPQNSTINGATQTACSTCITTTTTTTVVRTVTFYAKVDGTVTSGDNAVQVMYKIGAGGTWTAIGSPVTSTSCISVGTLDVAPGTDLYVALMSSDGIDPISDIWHNSQFSSTCPTGAQTYCKGGTSNNLTININRSVALSAYVFAGELVGCP